MIDRACISINNRCNLCCSYCHFRAPGKLPHLAEADMDVHAVLDNITRHVDKYGITGFKLGFVGNGEPLLDFGALKDYISHIGAYLADGRICAYTITNGTLVTAEMLVFFREHGVSMGLSVDGLPEIHDKYRCGTHGRVMAAAELYREINGHYPSMNCTAGRDVLERADETIAFFEPFGSRVTFSRMIGEGGITQEEFRGFLGKAEKRLNVRRGGYDCTMYGGLCGAGISNIFYANGRVYLCGNCVDLPAVSDALAPLDSIAPAIPQFDRSRCFRELSGL